VTPVQSQDVPSQFSALGFDVASGEDLAALASRVAERADTVNAREGQYLKWAPPSGEQLWLQVKHNGDAMGMNPHFEGRSSVRVGIEARVARDGHTPLDGTFLAWANPPADGGSGGDYPFVFDSPDAAVHEDLELPIVVIAQIAAFAQHVKVFASVDDYDVARVSEGLGFPSRSFIPSGLFSPDGQPVVPPEPHALIAGHVVSAEERRNAITGASFWWVLLDTVGGTFDAVLDADLVEHVIEPGNVISGWFWLSGRLTPAAQTAGGLGWWRRLSRR
jgi:hypothetical protein